MKKEKKPSLKTLQQKLFDLIVEKYYNTDKDIAEYVDKITNKKIEIETRKLEKRTKELDNKKVKKISATLSTTTLSLCDKLIVKERVSSEIMNYPITQELITAEEEIKASLLFVQKFWEE